MYSIQVGTYNTPKDTSKTINKEKGCQQLTRFDAVIVVQRKISANRKSVCHIPWYNKRSHVSKSALNKLKNLS